MYNITLNEKNIDIKSLEKEIYKTVCNVGCEIMSEILESIDLELCALRDVNIYRNKGMKTTHMHTVMGTVEYSRRIYKYEEEDGRKKYIRLLDKYLNNEVIGHMTTNLAEKITERVLEESYRNATEAINSISNASLSHTTIWNVTQEVGKKVEQQEEKKIKRYKSGDLNGDKEVEVLFQEADGLWLYMQGDDRPKSGKSKKRELKLAISYEGWKKREGQKEGYVVHNKLACTGYLNSKDFKELWDASIAEEYNVDEINMRIINGDGASWIKSGLGEEGVYFQLDPFHIAQAIVRGVPDKKEASELKRLFKEGHAEEGMEYITNLLIKYAEDEDKVKKLEVLYSYLSNNYEGIIPYHLRGLELPPLSGVLEYRNLGTMEHNICDILKLRMKGRKMSWSIKGANHLAKLLALRASGKLYDCLDNLFNDVVPSHYLEEAVEPVPLTAAQANKKPKKSKVYKVRKGSMPFEGQPLTEGMKAIRSLVKDRAISDITYR